MFISIKEKNEIVSSIMELQKQTRDLNSEVLYLKAKLKAAEGNIFVLKETIEQNKPKPKPKTTAAQRAKQREYMRAYKARKKAEKAAQLAQATA
jgi:hypothetical protein